MSTSPPLAVSVSEACAALGIGRVTLYRLFAAGEIPSFTVGRRRLVPRAELEQFIARNLAVEQKNRAA